MMAVRALKACASSPTPWPRAIPAPAGNATRPARPKAAARPRPPSNAKATLIESGDTNGRWKSGDRVFHDKFGYGTVRKADGAKYTVRFDKAGEKKVVENFLRELP